MIYYFFFFTISPLPHGPKITRLNKIHTPRINAPISEGHLIPIWRNSLGHILLGPMDEYPVRSVVLTDILTSNPRYDMVVSFILVNEHR